jgi:hypothetical protein
MLLHERLICNLGIDRTRRQHLGLSAMRWSSPICARHRDFDGERANAEKDLARCVFSAATHGDVRLLVGVVSQHDLPTGDVEGDTSNPRRGRRCEEERGGGDVLGLAYSPEGKGFAQGLPLGFWHP